MPRHATRRERGESQRTVEQLAKQATANTDLGRPKENHGFDYVLVGIGAVAELAAVRYGAFSFAWLAALMFSLAFYDYTKGRLFKQRTLFRFGAPIGVTCLLVAGTVFLTLPHLNTPAVEVPKKHGRIDFSAPREIESQPLAPFHKDQVPQLDTFLRNVGDAPVKSTLLDDLPIVVPGNELGKLDVFTKYKDKLKPSVSSGVLNPHSPEVFHSFRGSNITADQADKLNTGRDALCSIGLVLWNDDTGKYETDTARCLTREIDGYFEWHVLPEDNQEIKLP